MANCLPKSFPPPLVICMELPFILVIYRLAIDKGEVICLLRACSNPENFSLHLAHLIKLFRNRSFPKSAIKAAKLIRFDQREEYLAFTGKTKLSSPVYCTRFFKYQKSILRILIRKPYLLSCQTCCYHIRLIFGFPIRSKLSGASVTTTCNGLASLLRCSPMTHLPHFAFPIDINREKEWKLITCTNCICTLQCSRCSGQITVTATLFVQYKTGSDVMLQHCYKSYLRVGFFFTFKHLLRSNGRKRYRNFQTEELSNGKAQPMTVFFFYF